MQRQGSSPVLNPPAAVAPATTGGHAHPACAACNHQRKKCPEFCELAPYLPITRKAQFHKLQQVFGVSNLTKLLKNAALKDNAMEVIAGDKKCILDPGLAHRNRRTAVETLIWEAERRHVDPILGSYGEFLRISQEMEGYRLQNILLRQQNKALRDQLALIDHDARAHVGCYGWSNGNCSNSSVITHDDNTSSNPLFMHDNEVLHALPPPHAGLNAPNPSIDYLQQ